MSIASTAREFFEACETGMGWDGCKPHCHPDATFSAQSSALDCINTVSAYADWMKALFGPIPDGYYELKSFSTDVERAAVTVFAIFHGTHTVDGPVPAKGAKIASEYVYVIYFHGDKIHHVTKIWNDNFAMGQLGWS